MKKYRIICNTTKSIKAISMTLVGIEKYFDHQGKYDEVVAEKQNSSGGSDYFVTES